MANKTIGMLRLKQLFKLKSEGKSQRAIAGLLSINRDTVQRYLGEGKNLGYDYTALAQMPEEELWRLFEKTPTLPEADQQRKEALVQRFPYVAKELGRTGVDRHLLWQEYRRAHPGGYTYNHFCREFKRWQRGEDVSAIFDHTAGDKLFVDFAGK